MYKAQVVEDLDLVPQHMKMHQWEKFKFSGARNAPFLYPPLPRQRIAVSFKKETAAASFAVYLPPPPHAPKASQSAGHSLKPQMWSVVDRNIRLHHMSLHLCSLRSSQKVADVLTTLIRTLAPRYYKQPTRWSRSLHSV